MEDILVPIGIVGMLFIGLPWLILHHVTKWKTAATLTNDDERMLNDMNQLAARLEDRLETVERLVSQDNPNWQPRALPSDNNEYLEEFRIDKTSDLERSR